MPHAMGKKQTSTSHVGAFNRSEGQQIRGHPHVVLCGYYGFGNLGDELILQGILEQLVPANIKCTIISGNPEETSKRHRVSAISYPDVAAIVAAFRDADLVVIGGGGLFQEHWGTDLASLFGSGHANLTYYPAMAVFAASQGIPVVIHGVGVGPLVSASGKRLVRAAVEVAELVSVRDSESRDILAELGCDPARIFVSADPVFGLQPPQATVPLPARKRPVVGLNLRPWTVGVPQSAWEQEVFQALFRFAQRVDCEYLLLPFHRSPRSDESDEAVLARFREQAQERGISVSLTEAFDKDSMAQAIASCDLVVGMRYHAIALAAMAGTPLVALAYDAKVAHLMKQIGLPQQVRDLADCTADQLFALLIQSVEAPLPPRADPQQVERLKEAAISDGRRLLELLGSPQRQPRPLPPDAAWVLGQGLGRSIAAEKHLSERLHASEQQRAWAEAEREAAGRAAARCAAEADRLRTELQELAAKYQQLVEQYGERQQASEQLAAEREQLSSELAEWASKCQALVKQYEERQREVEKLHELLREITSSRWFRLASFYWRLRSRGKTAKKGDPPPTSAASSPTAGTQEKTFAETGTQTVSPEAPGPSPPALSDTFDVLCLPIIDWDFRFQRPQQLASQFARHGHRVFYVTQKFRSLGDAIALAEKGANIWEVSLKGPKRNVYQEAMDPEALEAYFQACDRLRREKQMGATAVVVQLPFWWPLAHRLRQSFGWPVIYDCMDYHAGFSTNRQDMLELEDELLKGADLVLASSQFLLAQCRKHNPRVLHLPNACDFEHFSQVPYRPPKNPPVIGYYGAIADWFDSELVADLAELRPDWRFLLVGSTFTADTKRLSRLPNVELVGEKPYSEIPQWVAQMDCLIIPFKRTPLTDATNPVKFFEIMAAGKPLVSVPLPELLPFREFVRFAETAETFAQHIELALAEEQPALLLERREFAKSHTWEKRFDDLYPEVVRAFPKASIVVVTYNNLHLTKQCLESVLARTEWPNFELFVVDNASADGTPKYLQELAQKDSRVHVILNSENRGFAAANNQALRQAQGEFLVLLNNDTVVTRGWLSGLIRHLSSRPDFGLVGPVTNWIGNEAQIKAGYSSLKDMQTWAADYVKAHDGEFFDIPVAALFCAAMRRDTFAQVGELDERFGVGMFEDDDYARRVREAGLRVVCVEDVFVHHHGKAAFKQMAQATYDQLFARNRALFEEKWGTPWVPHRYRQQ